MFRLAQAHNRYISIIYALPRNDAHCLARWRYYLRAYYRNVTQRVGVRDNLTPSVQ